MPAPVPPPPNSDIARLIRALSDARALSLDLDLTSNLDLDPDGTRQLLDFALNRARGLNHDRDLNDARALDRDLDLLLDRAGEIARARAIGRLRVTARNRARARDLRRSIDAAKAFLGSVIAQLERQGQSQEATADPSRARDAEPSRNALQLARLATALLPATHRARYREEFEAELRGLATRSRRAQWRYALRVAATGWFLRRALRAADRAPAPRRWWM